MHSHCKPTSPQLIDLPPSSTPPSTAASSWLSKASQYKANSPCPRACGKLPAKELTGPEQCFVQPTANDVIHLDGTKIAGAAMKRCREGLLVQGSIARDALPDDFDYQTFAEAFQQALANELAIPIGTVADLRTLFDSRRMQQERERFESATWINQR